MFPRILSGTYEGVGEGVNSEDDGEEGIAIHPRSVPKVIRALLFVQGTEKDHIFFDKTDWMNAVSLQMFNDVLKSVAQFSSIVQMEKDA